MQPEATREKAPSESESEPESDSSSSSSSEEEDDMYAEEDVFDADAKLPGFKATSPGR